MVRSKVFFPVSFGVIHLLVDLVTLTVIFGTISFHGARPFVAFYLVVSYDLIAFAGQALVGLAADKLRLSRSVVLAGIILCALAVTFLAVEPITAMILAGLGNALFHVGGGAMTLRVTPGRATAPGIFVGPGAIGLGLGTYMGKNGMVFEWPLLGLLAAAFVFTLFARIPEMPYARPPAPPRIRLPLLVMLLLLVSIAIRSTVGMSAAYECPRLSWIPVAFTLAAFGGKSLGGIVSDRIGWLETSVGALLISLPMIAFFGANPYVLVVGLFLFQMTMPVTLVAIASIIPGRPAFAFGIACLALVLGCLPTFYPIGGVFESPYALTALILCSAAALFVSLRLLGEKVPMKFRKAGGQLQ